MQMTQINNFVDNAQNMENNSELFASRRDSEFNPYSDYSADAYIFREEDIKSIIDDYNAQISQINLNNCITQGELLEDNQLLKDKNNFLKEKVKPIEIEKFQKINLKLDRHKQKFKQNAEILETKFDEFVKDSQNYIKDTIQKETQINGQTQQKNVNIQEPISNSIPLQEEQNFENSNTEKIKLLQKISQLIVENTKMQVKVIKEYCQKSKIRVCGRCKQKYSPLENNENSCQYHPGRLKYYSCLGCGGDEYQSCCMKCQNCSKGCRFDKHAALE